MKLSPTLAWKLVICWAIVLAVLYSAMSVVRHVHFQSGGFDLGLYDQAVWRYSRLLPAYNTVKERFILGDHLTLTLPLLAPLFWIWDNATVLLVFQALSVASSVIAVFLLVRKRKFSPLVAAGLSCIYSLFYGIQYGIFFDFHPVILATAVIPWMLYFLESGRKPLFWISLVIFVLTQENMGLALASIGFIYFFRKQYRRLSMLLIVGGVLESLIAARVIGIFYPFQYAPQLTLNPVYLFNAPEKQQVWCGGCNCRDRYQ